MDWEDWIFLYDVNKLYYSIYDNIISEEDTEQEKYWKKILKEEMI